MKIHVKYNYSNVIPDELNYLTEIVQYVCDHFFHENFNFYITNNTNINLNTDNNIVFLTGCEFNSKLKDNNFTLCFSNFYRNYNDNRYIAFPLGNNKFINDIALGHETIPLADRKYDVFFAGFIHPSRLKFKQCLEDLKCNKYIHYTNANNLQSFENNLHPTEYVNLIKNSKVVLAPMGAHHCTSYRYFESLYFQNIVFTEKSENQEIFLNKPFSNQFIVTDWSEISDSDIYKAIENYNKNASIQDYRNFFSKFSVTSFVIDKINQHCQ